ncbi:MAG: Gfo/Idh/MocA family oxidoreductase [Spirochaetaceae bacterium]|jgi:predicted dehydrogenase|nr:Gfo/Idh/MocA family oxidoreductase [Spirochaetaceae bacterium]
MSLELNGKFVKGPIRWGILGCGDVTEIKSGPGFSKAEGSSITACMRRDGKKAEDYAKRHNIPHWYDNADELINDPDVDAVYIATPPAYHKEYTLKSAAAGKPVYVEKPMAMNAGEVEEMIAACRNFDIPLFVAFYRRRLPVFVKIKELVTSGAIGTVRSMSVVLKKSVSEDFKDRENLPWRVIPSISGGGIFVDMGSHQLDILDWILGPIAEVRGFAVNRADLYKVEDGIVAALHFESGVIGTGLWDFTVSPVAEEDHVEITGDKGRLIFSTFDNQHILLESETGRKEWDLPHPPHVEQPLIQSIVDELHGKDVCPSTGETALRTTRIMDTLLKDYYR